MNIEWKWGMLAALAIMLLALYPQMAESEFDASRVDRWYERDMGERVGDFMIYQLKLKP